MTRRVLFVLLAVVAGLVALALPAGAAEQSAFAYGEAEFHGSTGVAELDQPVVGMAGTPSGDGYWLAARDGRVFAFGKATPLGSMAAPSASPVVAIAPTPSGRGYWLVTRSGTVEGFGDAVVHGSVDSQPQNAPIVDIAPTLKGAGYWLVAENGDVFAFGDAKVRPAVRVSSVGSPIADMAVTPSGKGYWLVGRGGDVSAFGDAPYLGSVGSLRLVRSVVSIEPTSTGRGYWLFSADGGLFTYGDAAYLGSLGAGRLTEPAVDIVASPGVDGYWLVTTGHLADLPGSIPPQVVLGSGTHEVTGLGPALPGTYRTQYERAGCLWERIGEDGVVLASGTNGLLTIRPTDKQLRLEGCAPFVNEAFPTRPVRSAPFDDGTWLVGADIGPWHWVAEGGAVCTWSRLSDLSGDADAVIESGDVGEVALGLDAVGFRTEGCGTWTRR